MKVFLMRLKHYILFVLLLSGCAPAVDNALKQGSNCQTTCPLGSNVAESRDATAACQASASANAIVSSGRASYACSGQGECLITCQITVTCGGGTLTMSRGADGSEELKCDESADPCLGIKCSNHGRCRNNNGVAECVCYQGYQADGRECVVTYGDGDIAADGDYSTDGDMTSDGDVSVDGDTENTNGSLSCSNGVCTDPITGFEWQFEPTGDAMAWANAITHCQNLNLNGTGWRLPNISELRSLVRNCVPIETAGACGVKDECSQCGVNSSDMCLEKTCQNDSLCDPSSCSDGGGLTGCYWPREVNGNCTWYLSASSDASDDQNVWIVNFNTAYVSTYRKADQFVLVRCVR